MNTLSLVKSDSLFSYTAPLNLLAWILHPLRFVVHFRHFIKLNRSAIKITHFPILALIFLYERTALCNSIFDRVSAFSRDNIPTLIPDQFDAGSRRFRGGSVAGRQQQGTVLDEVFREPYKVSAAVPANKTDARSVGTGGVVDSWMEGVVPSTGSLATDIEGGFATRRRVLTRGRRYSQRRGSYGTMEDVGPKRGPYEKHVTGTSRSVVSDPKESTGRVEHRHPLAEGDADNEEDSTEEEEEEGDIEAALSKIELSSVSSLQGALALPRPRSAKLTSRRRKHWKNASAVILRNPPAAQTPPTVESSGDEFDVQTAQISPKAGYGTGENSLGKKPPRSSRPRTATRPCPILHLGKHLKPAPNLGGPSLVNSHEERKRNLKIMEDFVNQDIAMVSSSFGTQMAVTMAGSGNNMLGRLVLTRISTLEEGMKDVKDILKEVKNLSVKNKETEKEREWEQRTRGGRGRA